MGLARASKSCATGRRAAPAASPVCLGPSTTPTPRVPGKPATVVRCRAPARAGLSGILASFWRARRLTATGEDPGSRAALASSVDRGTAAALGRERGRREVGSARSKSCATGRRAAPAASPVCLGRAHSHPTRSRKGRGKWCGVMRWRRRASPGSLPASGAKVASPRQMKIPAARGSASTSIAASGRAWPGTREEGGGLRAATSVMRDRSPGRARCLTRLPRPEHHSHPTRSRKARDGGAVSGDGAGGLVRDLCQRLAGTAAPRQVKIPARARDRLRTPVAPRPRLAGNAGGGRWA